MVKDCTMCGAWDSDLEGCTIPAEDLQYACPLEKEEKDCTLCPSWDHELSACTMDHIHKQYACSLYDEEKEVVKDVKFTGDIERFIEEYGKENCLVKDGKLYIIGEYCDIPVNIGDTAVLFDDGSGDASA